MTNSGTLFASGAHSLIEIASGATVTGGGIAKIANGVVDIAGAGDNQNVVFLAGGTGVLDIGVRQRLRRRTCPASARTSTSSSISPRRLRRVRVQAIVPAPRAAACSR